MQSDACQVYVETIPAGRVYHGVMCAVLILLAVAGGVLAGAGLWAGGIACWVTLALVGWAYLGCRRTVLTVTQAAFDVRYWLAGQHVPLDDIASVQVRDQIVLPPAYAGHVKAGYGWHSWPDLKVMVCRKGLPVVEIVTRDGVTVIVTPLDAAKLAQALHQDIQPAGAGSFS